MARYLLKHEANINAQSSPENKGYFPLIGPLSMETVPAVRGLYERQYRESFHLTNVVAWFFSSIIDSW